jgi:hypothetical protein
MNWKSDRNVADAGIGELSIDGISPRLLMDRGSLLTFSARLCWQARI